MRLAGADSSSAKARSNAVITSASLVASTTSAVALPPALAISATTASSRCCVLPAARTCCPSAANFLHKAAPSPAFALTPITNALVAFASFSYFQQFYPHTCANNLTEAAPTVRRRVVVGASPPVQLSGKLGYIRPEDDADSRSCMRQLRNTVFPGVLRTASHHKQIAPA